MSKIIQQVLMHEPHGNACLSEIFYGDPWYGFFDILQLGMDA